MERPFRFFAFGGSHRKDVVVVLRYQISLVQKKPDEKERKLRYTNSRIIMSVRA